MKKRTLLSAILIALLCVAITLSGCENYIEYFSKEENYFTVTGTLEGICYYPNGELNLDLSYESKGKLTNERFRIIEDNEKILRENNFYEEVRVDSVVVFVTADKRVGSRDKNQYHIFAIKFNGKSYLDFEAGKDNFFKYIGG